MERTGCFYYYSPATGQRTGCTEVPREAEDASAVSHKNYASVASRTDDASAATRRDYKSAASRTDDASVAASMEPEQR